MKSSRWVLIFEARFACDQVNSMSALYIQNVAASKVRVSVQFPIERPVTQHVGADGARTFVRVSVQPYTSDDDLAALEAALFSD